MQSDDSQEQKKAEEPTDEQRRLAEAIRRLMADKAGKDDWEVLKLRLP